MKSCINCKKTHYCGLECANKDWNDHRIICQRIAKVPWCLNCNARDKHAGVTCKLCPVCERIRYCGDECREMDAEMHREDCIRWKAELEKKAEDKEKRDNSFAVAIVEVPKKSKPKKKPEAKKNKKRGKK